MSSPSNDLPILFFDQEFPRVYADLTDGRANVVGPGDEHLSNADGVIAGARRPWNADAFALGRRMRVISRTGIGYDNVDVAAAHAAGVVVCNAPDEPTVSTAEMAISLMMAIGRDLPAQQARAREGLPGPAVGAALEFDGCTLGLLGFGRIARRVAAVGQALGMSVIAHDPFVDAGRLGSAAGDISLVSLDDLWARSDVLSLHAPSLPETRHIICTRTIAKMKPGVLVVNTARGPLIDQEALLVALDSGAIGAAGLDVTDPEPLPVGHALLSHPKAVVTPHVASSTAAGRRRLYEMGIENALNVLAGRPATIVSG
jgi:D-3-phosphoglycerate dehydrogenase / 2-oxoglutarate reductase